MIRKIEPNEQIQNKFLTTPLPPYFFCNPFNPTSVNSQLPFHTHTHSSTPQCLITSPDWRISEGWVGHEDHFTQCQGTEESNFWVLRNPTTSNLIRKKSSGRCSLWVFYLFMKLAPNLDNSVECKQQLNCIKWLANGLVRNLLFGCSIEISTLWILWIFSASWIVYIFSTQWIAYFTFGALNSFV